MIALALDTSGPVGSVALRCADGRVEEELMPDRGAGATVGAVAIRLLEKAGVPASALGLVAVGIGPGSYTGVRIAVTFAKTLAHALEIPLLGMSGLMVAAFDARALGPKVAVIEAGHATRVYAAAYDVAGPVPIELLPPGLHDRDAFIRSLPSGCALTGALSVSGAPPARVSAATLAHLARLRLEAGAASDDPLTLEPLYLQSAAPER